MCKRIMSYCYTTYGLNGETVVKFNKIEDKRVTVKNLDFVGAIYQARLLDYHLDYLSISDVGVGDTDRERQRQHHNHACYNLDNIGDLIDSLKDLMGKSNVNISMKAASMAPTGRYSTDDLPGRLFLNSKTGDYNYDDSCVSGVATDYGNDRERSFIKDFKQTNIYNTEFAQKGLSIVSVVGFGIINNFGGINININPKPDYAVIDANKKIVGFVEHKARTGVYTQYCDIFDKDIMQTAMYSKLNINNIRQPYTRCWLVQNFSEKKYVVTELDEETIDTVLDGIISQYHRIASDVKSGNVETPAGISYGFATNTYEHDFWRKIIRCGILNHLESVAAYRENCDIREKHIEELFEYNTNLARPQDPNKPLIKPQVPTLAQPSYIDCVPPDVSPNTKWSYRFGAHMGVFNVAPPAVDDSLQKWWRERDEHVPYYDNYEKYKQIEIARAQAANDQPRYYTFLQWFKWQKRYGSTLNPIANEIRHKTYEVRTGFKRYQNGWHLYCWTLAIACNPECRGTPVNQWNPSVTGEEGVEPAGLYQGYYTGPYGGPSDKRVWYVQNSDDIGKKLGDDVSTYHPAIKKVRKDKQSQPFPFAMENPSNRPWFTTLKAFEYPQPQPMPKKPPTPTPPTPTPPTPTPLKPKPLKPKPLNPNPISFIPTPLNPNPISFIPTPLNTTQVSDPPKKITVKIDTKNNIVTKPQIGTY